MKASNASISLKVRKNLADPFILGKVAIPSVATKKGCGVFRGVLPFLRYAGSKASLVKELSSLIPSSDSFSSYVEGCLGGGSLFFFLQGEGILKNKRVTLIEKDPDVASAWGQVQDSSKLVAEALEDSFREVTKERYDKAQKELNDRAGVTDLSYRAALVIYLTKTNYNGLWRIRGNGKYSVPWGKDPHRKVFDRGNLLAAEEALGSADIICGDYSLAGRESVSPPGAFVYFDPPYLEPETFKYNTDGFTLNDFSAMADLGLRLKRRGCKCMISNSFYPEVAGVMSGYNRAGIYRYGLMDRKSGIKGNYLKPEYVFRTYERLGSRVFTEEALFLEDLYAAAVMAKIERRDIAEVMLGGGIKFVSKNLLKALRSRIGSGDSYKQSLEEFSMMNKLLPAQMELVA